MLSDLSQDDTNKNRVFVNYRSKSERIEVVPLTQLQIEANTMDKEIKQQAKQINKAIDNATKFSLPRETLERYNKQFNRKDEKKAFKTVFVIFLISLAILLFFQPSIFFTQSDWQLSLENFSNRRINNISIYSLEDIMKNKIWPVKKIPYIEPNQKIVLDLPKENFYIAFSDRQLPTLGLYADPTKRLNNQENNILSGSNLKTPRDLFNEMSGG